MTSALFSKLKKKEGGKPHILINSMNCITYMDECGMSDLMYTANPYAWCTGRRKRRRINKRHDRVLINNEWVEYYRINRVDHHAKSRPDHSLITVKFENQNQNSEVIKYFKFLNF